MDRRLDFELRRAYSARMTLGRQLVGHVEKCDLCSQHKMSTCDAGSTTAVEYSIADRRYHLLKLKETEHHAR